MIRAAVIGSISLVALTACGSTDAANVNNQGPQTYRQGGGSGGTRTPPGATGLIAEASENTLQIQGQSQQTAVTFDANTVISQTAKIALTDVKVGDCVSSGGDVNANVMTTQMIRVTAAVNGVCESSDQRFNGGGQRGPGGPGGTRPSDAPNATFSFATGKVTSVTAAAVVITGQIVTGGPASSPTATPTSITITPSTDATITKETKATTAALVVGQCANALGQANDKGTIAATRITVSGPISGECQQGFGMGGPGGYQAQGGTSGT